MVCVETGTYEVSVGGAAGGEGEVAEEGNVRGLGRAQRQLVPGAGAAVVRAVAHGAARRLVAAVRAGRRAVAVRVSAHAAT